MRLLQGMQFKVLLPHSWLSTEPMLQLLLWQACQL
jgi:hypothetical protein